MLAYDQTRLHIAATQHEMTNDLTDPLAYPDAHRLPLPAATVTAELTGVAPGSSVFEFDELESLWTALWSGACDIPYEAVPASDVDGVGAPAATPTRRIVGQTRTLYRKDDLTALLPLGVLETHAIVGESYRSALTSGLLTDVFATRLTAAMLTGAGYVQVPGDTGWWMPSGRVFFSAGDTDTPATELAAAQAHFYVPCRAIDPVLTAGGDAAITRIGYDAYDLLPAVMTDAVSNVTSVINDYRVLTPAQLTDPNGNRAMVSLDVLGLVVGTAVMGKTTEALGDTLEALAGAYPAFVADLDDATMIAHLTSPLSNPGDILDNATTRIIYDIGAYYRDGSPPAVYTLSGDARGRPRRGSVDALPACICILRWLRPSDSA